MSSIFAMALEGADITGFTGSAEMAKLDSETEAYMESYITEDPVSFAEYVGECYRELDASTVTDVAAEGYFAVQYLKATDESTKTAAMESLSDKIEDAWDAIKRFIVKIWETIKKYAKKAVDFLKKRYDLGKAMLTKYSKVLRNKHVDNSIRFDWVLNLQNNIAAVMKIRAKIVKDSLNPIESGLQSAVTVVRTNYSGVKNDVDAGNWNNVATTVQNRINGLQVSAKEIVNSTQGWADELDDAAWGSGNKGPVYTKETWETIGSQAMHWADTDPSKTISEALGVYEKDTRSLNKLVGHVSSEIGKIASNAAEKAGFSNANSIIRGACRVYASGIQKANTMSMARLTAVVRTLQSMSIAACRKAITAKGTTSESTMFDFDSVIM